MGGQILGSMKNGIGKRAKGTISTKHLALFFANCLLGRNAAEDRTRFTLVTLIAQ